MKLHPEGEWAMGPNHPMGEARGMMTQFSVNLTKFLSASKIAHQNFV